MPTQLLGTLRRSAMGKPGSRGAKMIDSGATSGLPSGGVETVRNRGKMMSRYAKCAVTMLLVLGSAPAFAQQHMNQNTALFPSGGILEGSPQEQAACAADAHRYCRDEI